MASFYFSASSRAVLEDASAAETVASWLDLMASRAED
jgi:hypothetical protein